MSDSNQTKPCQCGKLMILIEWGPPKVKDVMAGPVAWPSKWRCRQCGHLEDGPEFPYFPSLEEQIELLRWQMANLVTPVATNAIPMGNRARVEMASEAKP